MKAAAVFIALIGLGQWGIGTALADDDGYLTELNNGTYLPNLHFNQPSSWLLDMGHRVCASTNAGASQRSMIQDVWHNGDFNLDAVQATALVNIAEQELCPS
jgi:hypothetical protein